MTKKDFKQQIKKEVQNRIKKSRGTGIPRAMLNKMVEHLTVVYPCAKMIIVRENKRRCI